eukprot:364891-Chlamydomonas_euryale.AAC.10
MGRGAVEVVGASLLAPACRQQGRGVATAACLFPCAYGYAHVGVGVPVGVPARALRKGGGAGGQAGLPRSSQQRKRLRKGASMGGQAARQSLLNPGSPHSFQHRKKSDRQGGRR